MEQNKKMSCLITGPEIKLGVVVLVAAVSVDSPSIWAHGHDEEPRSPPRPHKSELPSAANSGSEKTSPTVEKDSC